MMPDDIGRVSDMCQRGWDAGVILVVLEYPFSFMDSSKLSQSKVLISRARLSFSLFSLISMTNTKVSRKIPLPHHVITVCNVNSLSLSLSKKS